MGSTTIEWATHTWNPGIFGCEEVSPACANCYAAKMAHRLVAMGVYPEGITIPRASGVHWSGKVIVADEVNTNGLPTKGGRVFVTSMADLFHAEVPHDFIFRVFVEMERRPNVTFMVLTKRIETAAEFGRVYRWPANVWIGTTVEDQKRADERIPYLQAIDAPVRFLSCEPLLGPIDLLYAAFNGADSLTAMHRIDWVIGGGESGHGARPTHPDWARDLRDQCFNAGVPFMWKQWGDLLPACQIGANDRPSARRTVSVPSPHNPRKRNTYYKLGKAHTGRLLDGRTWDEFPTPRAA